MKAAKVIVNSQKQSLALLRDVSLNGFVSFKFKNKPAKICDLVISDLERSWWEDSVTLREPG